MVVVGVVAAIVVGVTGCASQAPAAPAGRFDFDFGHRAPHTAVPAPWAGGGDASVALGLLDELAVKGRAAKTGYRRSVFGRAWSDDVSVEFGGNGCKTRDDILRRDLEQVQLRGRCTVVSGVLIDPYTARRIVFERGVDVMAIQIDHLTPLSNAWQTGAQSWTAHKRLEFANDPRNLLAVSGAANTAKRDSDVATWLPGNKAYRCTYVAKQVVVKHAYQLWVTPAEKTAMMRILQRCR